MSKRPPKARPEITVDVVVFTIEDGVLKVLLIRRDRQPAAGQLALPGGFLWQNETAGQATTRILKDKAGLQGVFFEQLYTFDDLNRDTRGHVISLAHYALSPAERLSNNRLNRNTVLQAVDSAEGLPFDHNAILAYAVKRLRTKLGYSNVAYSLLPTLFTLSQLQEVYEVILGHEVDKRNFRKKIMSLEIIEPTEQKLSGKRHRPAKLYKFKKHGYQELEEPIF